MVAAERCGIKDYTRNVQSVVSGIKDYTAIRRGISVPCHVFGGTHVVCLLNVVASKTIYRNVQSTVVASLDSKTVYRNVQSTVVTSLKTNPMYSLW